MNESQMDILHYLRFKIAKSCPNYCEYCHNSGTRPVSLRRFVNLLSDLALNQLGLDISKERDRFGSYFVGLKIRDINDNSPPLITSNSSVVKNIVRAPRNTNVINKLWTLVMDKVTDVMDYVIDESIDGDGCDGCDGKNEKSDKFKNNVETKTICSTRNEEKEEKKEISPKFLNMPSHRGTKDTQQYIVQGVTDNSNAITVGDLVVVEDAPSYWSWASPFTVQSIDGEMARLEMIDELVEIARLSLS